VEGKNPIGPASIGGDVNFDEVSGRVFKRLPAAESEISKGKPIQTTKKKDMKMKSTQFGLLRAVAAFGVAAFAGSGIAQQAIPKSLGQVAPVNEVYGNEVISSDNQKVGKLNNLVIDIESGRILYGVIGASKGRVAVAPEIFASGQPANKELHIKADKAKLENAPQFSSSVDSPTGWGQASFVSQVYQYFGQNAWWQGNAAANQGSFNNVHKASDVISMKVENVNNQSLGKINNVMVDLPSGRIVYLILNPDSSLNLGNNFYALPPQAFTLGANGKNLVSNLDQQKLAAAPHFAQNNWPNLSDPNFATQVYQYYGKQAWFQSGGGSLQPTGR
jgi:sporulation protein YlmC with PRC-barrel domain